MSKIGMILEGLHQSKIDEGKIKYEDFKVKGNKFKLKSDTYYGSADAIMDIKKAKKLGFKIEVEDPDGYFEISIPKGTVLTATGRSNPKSGVELNVFGIDLDFVDPEDMSVERV